MIYSPFPSHTQTLLLEAKVFESQEKTIALQ